ncbi:MAG: uracil-DNA glycosylase [Bacteroidales bacterium]|jgi:uracil-DNA glycosylase|nr:uracil-DNA glycosylase [Bacteroidales bacterium]
MKQEKINPEIESSWKKLLIDEFNQDYFINLKKFLLEEKQNNIIYPKGSDIFNAFNFTPFNKLKLVILGQDPYHGEGQAHGLCFSVPHGIKIPPSLVNIYKEMESDLGIKSPQHGNLEKWAKQGVFLLNATLTVRKNQAGSHQNKGWEIFTDRVISLISEKSENIVFLLWGSYAQKKSTLIDAKKHLILKSVHPSPLSAYRGFFGCKHFSKSNDFLISKNIEPIDWTLE